MRRKKGNEQEAPATGEARITPEEVQRVEFRLSFRGYKERDVDAFLDRITADLSSYLDEMRSAAPSALPSSLAGAEPETIVAHAREEAAEIVRRADEQAEAIRAAAGAGGGPSGDRNAVAPFLNKERAFLQGLGSLVQTHAEEIRQMVLAIRERSAATGGGGAEGADRGPEAVAGGEEEPIDREPEERSSLEPASAAEIRERLAAGGSEASPVRLPAEDPGEPEQSEPIVVESATEPVYSTEGSPARERRERSLRELFWGEE
jgi:DivIVA domain-containing protein